MSFSILSTATKVACHDDQPCNPYTNLPVTNRSYSRWSPSPIWLHPFLCTCHTVLLSLEQPDPWQSSFALGGLCLETTWFTLSLPLVCTHPHLLRKVCRLPCLVQQPLPMLACPVHPILLFFLEPPVMFTCLLTVFLKKKVNTNAGRMELGLFCSLIFLCGWHIGDNKKIVNDFPINQ